MDDNDLATRIATQRRVGRLKIDDDDAVGIDDTCDLCGARDDVWSYSLLKDGTATGRRVLLCWGCWPP